ncbi:hemoglobin subunit beta-2-like [Myripristis murdjan]|uniref:hemoglobin subunit beta-2-like n=1 Tax=Myripristis murdjan TaxID=586833 RepID=UPI001175DD28|nr:hemoglobin subunit beta-2-like [Myripristis murdjan]
MVEWTDQERTLIANIFANLDYEDIGSKALARCLIVYPWTQRYFGGFGNLYNADAIMNNPMISAHGVKILHGLDRAVKNMDDIKNAYATLSELHSEKLHVDPDNFRLLSDCLSIVIASKMGYDFTPDLQAAWQKFLTVVVFALGRQYH